MSLTQNTRIAAWVCILLSVLTLPLWVLSLIEYPTNIAMALYQVAIVVLDAYVLLVLKNFLKTQSINWLIWLLIGFNLIISIIIFVIASKPELELIIGFLFIPLLFLIGGFYTVLGIKIRNINSEVSNKLESYAIITILFGIFTMLIFTLLITPTLSIISYIILANVFFKEKVQSDESVNEIHQEQVSGTIVKTEGFGLKLPVTKPVGQALFLFLLGLVVLDVYSIAHLYEVYKLPLSNHDGKVEFVFGLLSFLVIAIIFRLLKHYTLSNNADLNDKLRYWIKFLLYTSAAFLSLSIYFMLFPVKPQVLSWMSSKVWLQESLTFIFMYAFALGYLQIGLLLAKVNHPLNGYRKPLVWALIAYAAFTFAYFFDTPIYSSHSFLHIVLGLFLLSIWRKKSSWNCAQKPILQNTLISLGLVVPLLVYIGGYVFKYSGFIMEHSDDITEYFEEVSDIEVTPTKKQSVLPKHLNGYKLVREQPNFDWMVDHDNLKLYPVSVHKAYGIDTYENKSLYVSNDTGRSWESVLPDTEPEPHQVQYSHAGKNFWVLYAQKLVSMDVDNGEVPVSKRDSQL